MASTRRIDGPQAGRGVEQGQQQEGRREDHRLRVGDLRMAAEHVGRPERRLAARQALRQELDLRLEVRLGVPGDGDAARQPGPADDQGCEQRRWPARTASDWPPPRQPMLAAAAGRMVGLVHGRRCLLWRSQCGRPVGAMSRPGPRCQPHTPTCIALDLGKGQAVASAFLHVRRHEGQCHAAPQESGTLSLSSEPGRTWGNHGGQGDWRSASRGPRPTARRAALPLVDRCAAGGADSRSASSWSLRRGHNFAATNRHALRRPQAASAWSSWCWSWPGSSIASRTAPRPTSRRSSRGRKRSATSRTGRSMRCCWSCRSWAGSPSPTTARSSRSASSCRRWLRRTRPRRRRSFF